MSKRYYCSAPNGDEPCGLPIPDDRAAKAIASNAVPSYCSNKCRSRAHNARNLDRRALKLIEKTKGTP